MAIDTRTLQRLLNDAGADPKLAVDGIIGSNTIAAIKAAKVRAGIPPTGVADAALVAVLERLATPSPVQSTGVQLRRGDRGDAVADWQRLLFRIGYSPGPDGRDPGADGIFGAATERETRRIQVDSEIGVTSIVDEATRAAAERSASRIVVQVRTTLLDRELMAKLVAAHVEVFGTPPSRPRLVLLCAQIAMEHNAGKDTTAPANGRAAWFVYNWNFGNRRVPMTFSGPAYAATAEEQTKPGIWQHVRGLWPAYDTPERGLVTWLTELRRRYSAAIAAADTGNAATYTKALKDDGYFTANLAPYLAGVTTWQKIFDRIA